MVTVLPLSFTEDGLLADPNEQAQIIAAFQSAQPPISDLWIFSHGWNNGRDDALHLYNDEFIPCMQEAIAALQPVNYNPLYVGVIWPSKGWEEFSNTNQPAPGASTSSLQKPVASLIAQPPISKAEFIDTFAQLPLRQDGKNDEYVSRLGELYDRMTVPQPQDDDIKAFFQLLQDFAEEDPQPEPSTRNVKSMPASDGIEWIKYYHSKTQQSASKPVDAEAVAANQNADTGNWFDTFLNVFRVFTFWQMKNRAGVVGANGLYTSLVTIKQQFPQLRIHLLGHSFGGRLISAAVYNLTQQDPLPENITLPFVNTLITLQGAFSQFSFTQAIMNEPSGIYNPIVEKHAVANPLMAIYSEFDTANRMFYPLGMGLFHLTHPFDPIKDLIHPPKHDLEFHAALDAQVAFVPSNDEFGAIGANGMQGFEQNRFVFSAMNDMNQPYTWGDLSQVYCINIDGQKFISANTPLEGAHNDINHPEIFQAALSLSLYGI